MIRVFVLHPLTKFQVRRPFHSEDTTHFLPVSVLVDLVTLTFDLETGSTFVPILVFVYLFLLHLGYNTCQTDNVTLRVATALLETVDRVPTRKSRAQSPQNN